MEQKAQEELVTLFRDAIKVGGAAIEMRVRRFASFVRASDETLAHAITPLVTGGSRSLRREISGTPIPVDVDTKLPLVRVEAADTPRQAPLLNPHLRIAVEQLLKERQASDTLMAHGLTPVKSVLMSGPPGVGKTMTAGWLATQLGLPLLTLDLASVMSSYLGKTGANLRAVLTHAQQQPCVLLLDEFDSIAKRRDDDSDVGELKRLVTVILQTIDDWSPTSLLVAATNHGELLDPAVWRRFDINLTFTLPEQVQRAAMLNAQGIPQELADAIATVAEGQTFSAISRALDTARKMALLENRPMDEALASWAVSLSGTADKSVKKLERDHRDLQVLVHHGRQQTAREIADILGTSHTTVIRSLKRFKGDVDVRA